ncbi:MAG: SDR family NAD(P)-dependent oxidoreductase, partial [Pseudomonas sp.]
MTTHYDFSGKTVLVTGGAQGIGQAIVEGFAASGAKVLIADLNLTPAQALAGELREQGMQANAVAIDLADRAAIFDLLASLERLDILVHNAAYFPLTPFTAISADILERTLAVNLSALFWLAQAALPLFQRQGGGNLLVTSSVTGPRVAFPGLS